MVNTTTRRSPVTSTPESDRRDGADDQFAPGFFFKATSAKFEVGGVLKIEGDILVTRQPNGTLDVAIGNAGVTVTVSGTDVFTIRGSATFTISPATGFRCRPSRSTASSSSASAPGRRLRPRSSARPPTSCGRPTSSTGSSPHRRRLQRPQRRRAQGTRSSTPATSSSSPQWDEVAVNPVPTLAGPNTYRYTFTGPLPNPTNAAQLSRPVPPRHLHGRRGGQHRGTGTTNFAEVEQVFLVAGAAARRRRSRRSRPRQRRGDDAAR